MKKLFTLILVSAAMLNSCKKPAPTTPEFTNVSTERKSLMFDFTGLQCGICAGMLPSWNAMLSDHQYNAIGLSVHCGVQDSLDNNFTLWMSSYFNVTGTPSWAEGANMTLASYDNMKSSMETTVKQKADLGIGVVRSLSGTTMTIKTHAVLFNDMSGDYNIAVYVIENGVRAVQISTVMTHNDVLRGGANGMFGTSLFSGSQSKGQTFDQTFTYNIGTQGTDYVNAANLRAVVVVYRMNGTDPKEVINCNEN
jgi:hypothetical protein